METTEIFEEGSKEMMTTSLETIPMARNLQDGKGEITEELSEGKKNEGWRPEYSGRSENWKINADEPLKTRFPVVLGNITRAWAVRQTSHTRAQKSAMWEAVSMMLFSDHQVL